MKQIHIYKCLLSILCVVGLWSCSPEDLWTGGGDVTYKTDTYQSDLRQSKNDSITFVLNPDVKIFSEAQLKNLVELRDDSILVFSSELPEQYLPKPGDIYIYSTGTGVDCEALQYGFMRRVESVEQATRGAGVVQIHTVGVFLNEIFQYIKATAQIRPSGFKGTPYFDKPVWSPPSNVPVKLGDCLTYTGSFEMRLSGQVDINMNNNTFLINMTPIYKFDGKTTLKVGCKVGFDDTKKHLFHVAFVRFCVPLGEILIPMSFGINEFLYFTAEGSIEATTSVKGELRPFTVSFGIKSGRPYCTSGTTPFQHLLGDDFSYEKTLGLNLSAGIGFRTLFGVNVLEKPFINVDGAYLDIWAGASSKFTFDLDQMENAPQVVRDTPIEVTGKLELGFDLKYNPIKGVEIPIDFLKYSPDPHHFFDLYLWPDFSYTTHTVKDNDVTLRTRMERDMLFPVRIGYTITDDQGNDLEELIDNDRFYWVNHFYDNPLSKVVYNLEEGKTYYAHPTVHYLNLNRTFAPRDYKPYPFSLESLDPPFYGVWELTYIKGVEDGESYEGKVTPDELICLFTLREDGTFHYYAWGKGDVGEEDEIINDSGTWNYENGQITLIYDNGYYISLIKVLKWTPTELVTYQEDEGNTETRTFTLKE